MRRAVLVLAAVVALGSMAAAVQLAVWGAGALSAPEARADTAAAPGGTAAGGAATAAAGPRLVPVRPGAEPGRAGPPAALRATASATTGPLPGVDGIPDGGFSLEKLLFLVFAVTAALLALSVIGLRNPLSGALCLVGSFFCLAALYAMLGAHFIAAIQIIIYAGAVMVLFVFVIMLLNLSERELGEARHRTLKALGVLLLGGLTWLAWDNLAELPKAAFGPAAEVPADFGGVKDVGRAVFGTWLLPFEVAGLVLLVAVVGAVALSRRAVPGRPAGVPGAGAGASASPAPAPGGGH